MQRFFTAFEKYFFWILLGLLVFIPIYPKFPLINVSGTYVAVRIEDLFIAAVFGIWFVGNLNRMKFFLSQTIFQVILLFWFIGAVSLFSALLITHTVTFQLGFFNWLRRVEVMSLFLVSASTIKSVRQIKITLLTMLIVTMLISLYGFGQILLAFKTVSTNNSELSKGIVSTLNGSSRVNSTFAGHYDLAIYLSMVLAILGSLFFYYKKLREKILITFSALISFILLGLTTARVSFIAALFSLVIDFWSNGKKVLIIVVFFAAILAIAAIPDLRHRFVATVTVNLLGGGGPKYEVPSGLTYSTNSDWYRLSPASRAALLAKSLNQATLSATQASKIAVDIAPGEPVNQTEQGVYRSFGIRFNVEWPRAIRAFAKNPLLGTGYSSITLATDNDILRALGETGLLGAIFLALVFIAIFKKMATYIVQNSGFRRGFIIGVFSATLALLITSTFIDVLEASKVSEIYWILAGLAWALMVDFKYAY